MEVPAAEGAAERLRRHVDLARARHLAGPDQEALDLIASAAQFFIAARHRAVATDYTKISHGSPLKDVVPISAPGPPPRPERRRKQASSRRWCSGPSG